MKVGIFGGAFNPPHVGHLLVAGSALRELGLDKLLVVPSSNPPHRSIERLADDLVSYYITRVGFCIGDIAETVDKAVELGIMERDGNDASSYLKLYKKDFNRYHDDRIESSAVEFSSPCGVKTYTIDTLNVIGMQKPDWELTLVIGSDQAEKFDTWKNWRGILDKAQVAVAGRPGYDKKSIVEKFPAFLFFDSPQSDASSSEIRRRIREGESLERLTTRSLEFLLSQVCHK